MILLCLGLLIAADSPAQSLDEQLRQTPAAELAARAKVEGDAARGAVLFFQPHLACARCHAVEETAPESLGPPLPQLGRELSDEGIVDAILTPSKTIRKGFESVTVVTKDGRTLAGIVAQRDPEALVLRDASRQGLATRLPLSEVDHQEANPLSLMPAGQMNQLTSIQQFLDLVRYVAEVRDGGVRRARELQPPPSLLAQEPPAYESRLDHAGLIRSWNQKSLRRGEAIYRRVCINCHGDHDQPGSLPTSLRFATGKFKNGSDPLSLYRTLTLGFGQMAAQTWMVPSQKYDVIHYLREAYLKSHNPSQFVEVNAEYLARLPVGDTRGPEPSLIENWVAMDYGPSLIHTYEVPGEQLNFAYKGVAIRLDSGPGGVSRGGAWMLFDTDTLRVPAAWRATTTNAKEPRFIDWESIQFNGRHGVHPHLVGDISFANAGGPGWAEPASGAWDDSQRVQGRDERRYGPLPHAWGKYRGLYHHENHVVLSYEIGGVPVLECPDWLAAEKSGGTDYFLRRFEIGPRDRPLRLRVADLPETPEAQDKSDEPARRAVEFERRSGLLPAVDGATWSTEDGKRCLTIPAGDKSLRFTVWYAANELGESGRHAATTGPAILAPDQDLRRLTNGGAARWPTKLRTTMKVGADSGPFAVDTLTAPESNPWLAQLRFTGLDFFADGSLAACTWDGDVWLVKGLNSAGDGKPATELEWQRIASGLFQPLGLKIVGGKIHLTCRDQLVVLHDLNGDGETDFYQCLNNDHQVTEHFHEFAMGLQTDSAGNFYYAKSGRHALPAVVPQHGTLLRVSPDGERTEILATGFRAANGVCLNPDGSFVVTDQEGFWNPKNRINWVTVEPGKPPKFYGNMFGYHDVTDSSDSAMEPPLCWITNAFDRSPAELLWVDSPAWGPLHGQLLNLSYGYGKVFLVPHEEVGGVRQGGMIELPIPAFPTGVMRGRFAKQDGHLYLAGMYSWAGNATYPGGLYRIRATGKPATLPVELHALRGGMQLRFTSPLAAESVVADKFSVKVWALKRTQNYGSPHLNEHALAVTAARLEADGQTVRLEIPDLEPTWCMEIRYTLRNMAGEVVTGTIHNTIHRLP